MTPAIALFVIGAILLKAGFKNMSIVDVALGRTTRRPRGNVDPMAGFAEDVMHGAPGGDFPARGNGLDYRGGVRVRMSPGADRSGVPTIDAVKVFLSHVGELAGIRSITVGTGSNHPQYTTNGNVSNHWNGHAADVPASGKTLTRLGRAALVAAGMPREQAMRANGDIYNVGPWQIIFNTDLGGGHWDHLHVGKRL